MDPLTARNIEVKRSALAILYLRKIVEWLSKPRNQGHKNYQTYECARKAISGEVRSISLRTFEALEIALQKKFDIKVIDNVDLTREDDEDHMPPLQDIEDPASPSLLRSAEQPEVRENIIAPILDNNMNASGAKESTSAAEEPVQIEDDTLANANSAENHLESSACTHKRVESIEELNLPAVMSPDAINEALGIVLSAEDQPKSPQPSSSSVSNTKILVRRNSVYDPNMPKPNVPSIADYKLKQSKLQPPSVYAKPIEKDKGERKIITVPYKTAPRQLDGKYDPKADLIKLQGIKEKIYAKEYLQFDAKQDVLKEHQSKEAEKSNTKADYDSSDDSDDSLDLPITKKRKCTSTAEPKKSSGKKRGRPRKKPAERNGSQERKKSPAAPPKKQCRRLDSSDDEVTHPPSHVLEDNVEHDLEKLFAESTSDSSQLSDHRGAVLSTKSILKSSSSLLRARTDSIADRSQLVAGKAKKGRKVQNNGTVPVTQRPVGRGRGRGRGLSRNPRSENPSTKVSETVPVVQKPVRGRGRGRGRGRKRIPRIETNIVSQFINTATYCPLEEFPQDFPPNVEADPADDDLLVEIPGTAKKPKGPPVSPVVRRYPKRRNAIDQKEVQLNVEIKVEASVESIVVKQENSMK